jgi:retron-type reverse transcriptase
MLDRESRVLALQAELRAGRYRPSGYRTFVVHEPKARTISAAVFRDRVVHHALCAEIEPDLERGACDDSYACRRGKGTLAAVWRAAGLVRRHRYVLKLDVEHFFETLDHAVLVAMLRTRLRDDSLTQLAEAFVRAGAPGSPEGRGVPIGNLTSQHFANFYLGSLDRLVTRGLSASGYVRYMDDVLVFADDRATLWSHLEEVERFVSERLHLKLKARATRVQTTGEGVSFLGWRLFPGTVRFDGARRRRFVRRVRETVRGLASGGLSVQDAAASMGSVVAWSRWGHTGGLRRSVLESGDRRGW